MIIINKRRIKICILICLLAGLAGLLYYFKVADHITLENIKQESECLRLMVQNNYLFSVLVYVFFFVLFLVAGFPSTIPMVLLSGYLFGTFFGALYATLGATIGSVISFFLFRYWIKEFLQERYKKRLVYFEKQMEKYGIGYLLVLHYTSVVPFFVINMIAALTHVSLKAFIFTCLIGSFPVYCIFASAGMQLSEIHAAGDIFSGPVIAAFVLLITMAFVSMIMRKIRLHHEV